MTGLTVPEFGYVDRGVIREGAHEEITLFDPASVHDRRTRLRGAERASCAALVGGGGNSLSALVAVLVLSIYPRDWAPALRVGLPIAAMMAAGALHPQSGAEALLATLNPRPVLEAGPVFALAPVGLMTAAPVCAGILFNRVTGRLWPRRSRTGSRPDPSAPGKPVLRAPRRGLQESQITSIAAGLVEKSGRTK